MAANDGYLKAPDSIRVLVHKRVIIGADPAESLAP